MAKAEMKFKKCPQCRWHYKDILTGRTAAEIACEFCRRWSNFEPMREGDEERIRNSDEERTGKRLRTYNITT